MEHTIEEYGNIFTQLKIQDNYEIQTNAKLSDTIFSNIEKYKHEEYQYLNLLENILENGFWEEGRNGKVKSIFGYSMRFSLQNNKIPIITTKKTAWKTCLKELLWFIKGDTNNKILQEQGVHIWDANSSKSFMESRGLTNYPDGELGPIYGYQWRNFNAYWDPEECNVNRNNGGIDQLQEIIDHLKDPSKRNSRRLIMTAWNPCQLNQMALPPCHILCQFNVHDGNKLSCALYQRSCDEICGQPFNIASYSFLTHLIAKHCGLEAYEFIYFMGNCHIYEQHIEAAKLQIERNPYDFPTILIKNIKENIDDYNIDDFIINNYICHDSIKVKMVA
jgi:thymidylate synthase